MNTVIAKWRLQKKAKMSKECVCNDTCGHYAEVVDIKRGCKEFRELARTRRLLLESRDAEVSQLREQNAVSLREAVEAQQELERRKQHQEKLKKALRDAQAQIDQLQEVNKAMMIKMGRLEARHEQEKAEVVAVIEGREREHRARLMQHMAVISRQQQYIHWTDEVLTPEQKSELDRRSSESFSGRQ
jgi:chromosome segregation ATPase